MISQGQVTPCKNRFLTSPKSQFGPVRRQKMISHGQATPSNITFSTSTKSHFGLARRQKMNCQGLKYRFLVLAQVALWVGQKAEN
jgi:hypothetical protein